LNQIIKSTFTNTSLEIDGNAYLDCVIDHCVLIYRGGDLPSFSGCQISHNTFRFEDAALRTITFLGVLNANGFQDVVQDFVRSIQSTPPPSGGSGHVH
jgi:hypothetical protein